MHKDADKSQADHSKTGQGEGVGAVFPRQKRDPRVLSAAYYCIILGRAPTYPSLRCGLLGR
jgi:hypothetical protein